MSKLVLVNSFGPMGSTLLAGLLEKFGFGNAPLRKIHLHQYLMEETDLNSGLMQKRLEEILISHSKPSTSGGVSVLDRSDQKPKALTDINLVRDDLEQLKKRKFSSIEQLYQACRETYFKAIVYKPVTTKADLHMELTVDIHRFNPDELYARYQDNFKEVYMIHLHRNFKGWINSLASQAFVHPEIKNRIKFFPHLRYADYDLYERSVARMPGLHMPFDELFDTPVEDIARRIAAFVKEPVPVIDLRNEKYDLYGKSLSYQKAFTRFDDNIEYLKPATLDYFEKLACSGGFKKPSAAVLAWGFYLRDMIRFRMQRD